MKNALLINSRIFYAQKATFSKFKRTPYALYCGSEYLDKKQSLTKTDYSGTSIMHPQFMGQPTFKTNWGQANMPYKQNTKAKEA